MYIIGERINGMFKDVAQAIRDKDKKVIHNLVNMQIVNGANALDVNVGPSSAEPKEAMEWLVRTITEITSITLAIDTTKLEVMEAGLKLSVSKPIINSVNANDDKLKALFSLAKKYNASLIALTMDKSGIPKDADGRLELAMKIINSAIEHNIDIQDIFIDPVILPVNVAQSQAKEVLRTIREVKMLCDPPPNTILGLSNVSQGSTHNCRPLINRTFLTMAIANGLTAAIMDTCDKALIEEMITSELLLDKQLYCDSYIEAYKSSLKFKGLKV